MKESVKVVGVLFAVTVIVGLAVASVKVLTEERIAQADVDSRNESLLKVMPGASADSLVKIAYTYMDGLHEGYECNGSTAIEVSSKGYGGELRLLVGFGPEGKMADYVVLAHSETPGLGAKVDPKKDRGFHDGVVGMSRWNVKKDGGKVDAITAATITSRAACKAFNEAAARRKAMLAARGASAGAQ